TDMTDVRSLDIACREVETVIHLAAMNEIDSAANPEQALLINGLGTLKLLQAAERAGVKRFIYFSTAHIYGAPLTGTITEKTLPRPVHPYAITHRVAEDFVLSAHDAGNMTGIVLRLSNAFGEPATPDINRWTLIGNDLCRQAVTTGSLVLRSSGVQQRDFIPLDDVSAAVIHLLDLPADECGDGIFNLGSGQSYSIMEFAERVQSRCTSMLGFTPPIKRPQPDPTERAEPLNYRSDKLKATGYAPGNGFDDEIDRTVRFCRETFGTSSLRSSK
ncbi:MAG TPA: SDR family oxidoreductase, partial [Nitrospirota bacterium]|nr:SDR family oxidoreductase [Nitrospirota bacterium]